MRVTIVWVTQFRHYLYCLIYIYWSALGNAHNGGQSQNNLAPLQPHYETRYKFSFFLIFLPIDKTAIIVSGKWTGKRAAQCMIVIAPVSSSHLYAWISVCLFVRVIKCHPMPWQSIHKRMTSHRSIIIITKRLARQREICWNRYGSRNQTQFLELHNWLERERWKLSRPNGQRPAVNTSI